ncbi:MarR family winged helix-turn-helix transcriptional regulator [Loktanella sp. Alg231-35]|uniref:MarR family winged helix-turn-helix transcriptional regulator n=1 Tax=Loktanella sp. Alg231-35 TaxID=1922220 RepID=UPI00131EF9D5|nr:MarR family transcriptional regulator [Loktanella sp. Alg231-35]
MSFLLRHASLNLKEVIGPTLKESGISTLEFFTLRLIQTNESSILRTLANAIGVEPPAMNRIMNGLEDKELASRNKSIDDARYTYFKLTNKGVEILRAIEAQFDEAERGAVKTLSNKEKEALIALLQRVIRTRTDS